MSTVKKEEFKSAVITAFEEKGYTKIKLSMAFFGMQCDVTYHQDGMFGKQEAKVYLKESGERKFLEVEQKNGIDWKREISG